MEPQIAYSRASALFFAREVFWLIFLVALALLGVVGACTHPGRSAKPPVSTDGSVAKTFSVESTLAAEQITALAEAYTHGFFDYFPELGTYYGIPGLRHDRLHNNSLAARQAWSAREDA